MEIGQIVAVGIISMILAIIIKNQYAEMSILITVIASTLIFMMIFPKLFAVVSILKDLSQSFDANLEYVNLILKIIGIAYISEFGAQICIDAGQSSIASKIELGGKVLIMTASAPILVSLLESIVTMLP